MDLEFLQTDPEFYEHLALIDCKLQEKKQLAVDLRDNQKLVIYKDEQKSILRKVEEGIEYYSKVKDLLNELRNFKSISYSYPVSEIKSTSETEKGGLNELKMLTAEENDETPITELANQPQPPPVSKERQTDEEMIGSNTKQRTFYQLEPKHMLKEKYRVILEQKGKTTKDVLDSFFSEHKTPFYDVEITKILYNTSSDEDLKRCKASISAQLRDGAKEKKAEDGTIEKRKRWLKLAPSRFAALDYKPYLNE